LQADAGEVSPVLFDLVIERMRDVGIQVDGIDSAPLLDRVQIAGSTDNTTGGVGLLVSTDSGAPPTLVARDCVFSHNATYGLQVAGGSRTRFERCRFQGNGSDAASLAATTTSATRVELADCLIANNDYAGLRLFATLPSSTLVVRVERCTIAGNGAEGIVGALASSSSLLELDHAADLAVSGTVAPTRSLIGDGSFAGVNGCFAADPLFVQPSAGDFRVKWSSPCIDAAWVATPAGALDLLRHPRDVDGDLDTSEIDDLGAFEFRPLELVGSGALGTLLTWESWGPKANLSTILWTSGQLPFTPTSTPFGEYDLTSLTTSVFRVTTVGASAPTSFQRIVPPDPLMVGQTFSFQALTDNALAPNGKAYTNLVRVTIAP
jgi:hypothetical protein